MNFYQTQHEFYCGIDLHANQMYACIVDRTAFAERIEKKHSKARAQSYLAVKLGRAVYHMLRRGEAFELDRMLR